MCGRFVWQVMSQTTHTLTQGRVLQSTLRIGYGLVVYHHLATFNVGTSNSLLSKLEVSEIKDWVVRVIVAGCPWGVVCPRPVAVRSLKKGNAVQSVLQGDRLGDIVQNILQAETIEDINERWRVVKKEDDGGGSSRVSKLGDEPEQVQAFAQPRAPSQNKVVYCAESNPTPWSCLIPTFATELHLVLGFTATGFLTCIDIYRHRLVLTSESDRQVRLSNTASTKQAPNNALS